MQTWEWVVIAVVLAGAVLFTLVWWWLADKWADSEHKRFKGKSGPPVERVVIKTARGTGADGTAQVSGGGAGGEASGGGRGG